MALYQGSFEDAAVRLYLGGETIREVATSLGCGYGKVHKTLTKLNLTRERGRPSSALNATPRAFDEALEASKRGVML